MASKIQVRRDTLSNWNANNPVLSSGEIAFVTDENKFKVGNGSTAFTSLSYLQADAYIDSVILGTDTTGNYIATIAGTTDQVSVSGSGSETAAVTLSLPQSIATTSSPTFAGATIDSVRVGVTAANEIDTSDGNLILDSTGGQVTVDDNLVVTGDMTVQGTTTFIDTTHLQVEDKNIEIGKVAEPTDTTADGGGITLLGTTNKTISWSDTTDSWTFSEHIDLVTGKVIKINGSEVLSSTQYTGNAATATNADQLDGQHGSYYAPIASPTFTGTVTAATLDLTTAATETAASSYFVENGSDGVVRPKTLANVITEVVTTAAVNSAAATTVGTITTGTWAATDVGLAHGGTNASLTAANGAVVYSTASAFALTSVGTAGQVLTSNGSGAPTWQAAASGGLDGFFLPGL